LVLFFKKEHTSFWYALMKLLISAYACAPNRGSEHASAWNWTTEARRLGHDVWVLTSPAHKDSVLAASGDWPLRDINWIFPEVPFWPLKQGSEPKWERSYNLLWQVAALRAARKLHTDIHFDLVHHLTWAGIRAPTFIALPGAPLIIGPVGGGETSPKSLRPALTPKGRVTEAIRDISNATITLNPMVRYGLDRAAVIFVRTADTKALLTPAMRQKTRIMMELGVPRSDIGGARGARQSPPRLLFAGRLLYWKGVHIAVAALALLCKRLPETRLTIVGSGPEEPRLRADVAARGLERNVEFIAWMKQPDFLRLYAAHDLFVFPSLHDSAGWVVLESLCQGVPVVCLDCGGPKEIVTRGSGLIIATSGRSTRDVAASMAEQMHDVLASPGKLAELSAGAIARAHDFLLSKQVVSLYDQSREFIQAHSRPGGDDRQPEPVAEAGKIMERT